MAKDCINCRFGCDNGLCPHKDRCFTSTLDQNPTHWKAMTEAQKLEKEMSNTKTDKKLVGDITSGYSYVDTDMAAKIRHREIMEKMIFQLPMAKYNEMYIKKENKKMDIKLYECGTFIGGVVTKPQDLIKNVIFSGPCTIVQWSDGDKTVVRCENEDFDKEKGLAMAIVKKFFGTNGSKSNYNDIFKKWIPEEKIIECANDVEPVVYSVNQLSEKEKVSKNTILRRIKKGLYPGSKKINGVWWIPYSDIYKED